MAQPTCTSTARLAVLQGGKPGVIQPKAVPAPPHPQPAAAPGSLGSMWRALGATAAAATLMLSPLPAQALLNSPNAQIARTADAALRRAIPAFNDDVKEIQDSLERIAFKLRIPQRKPWGSMGTDLADAVGRAGSDTRMLRGVLPTEEPAAQALVATLRGELDRLTQAVALKDADRTSIRVANSLAVVADLELLQAPGLPYRLPQALSSLPLLTGRAVVEVVVEKADGSAAFVPTNSEAGPQKQATLRLVVDGYSAPVTGGNFVVNVLNGVYNGMRLSVGPTAVLAGPQGAGVGSIPLEILPLGDFEPLYRAPVDVRSGELPVLPLSIYGAVAMAHLPGSDASAGYVSSQRFFMYKFERQQSGLAGLSFDEGEFGVLGYVTRGQELLRSIEDGDVLVSAKVVAGEEKLLREGTSGGRQGAEVS